MRELIIFAALFLCSIQVFGQDTIALPFGQDDINLSVDSLIFNKKVGATYLSESTGASILCMIMPMTYKQLLPGMQNESNDQAEVVEQYETTFGDKRTYVKKGRVVGQSDTIMVEGYLIEISSSNCLMVTGKYDASQIKTIGDSIEKAAKSVTLIK